MFVIVIRSWARPSIISNMMESIAMCQERSSEWTLDIYGIQAYSRWLLSHTQNTLSMNLCKFTSNLNNWCIHNLPMNVPFINLICNKFPLPLLICGKDVEHFFAFSKPIWNARSILNTLILRVGYTISMDIMRQNGIFIWASVLGWILCLSSTSTILNLCSI